MSIQLVEEAWVLWQRLGFREMVECHPTGPKPHYLRRLWRLRERARLRYYRRKRAIGGEW
jgi:hypothetical protein